LPNKRERRNSLAGRAPPFTNRSRGIADASMTGAPQTTTQP